MINPRFINEQGGILVTQDNGIDLYIDSGELYNKLKKTAKAYTPPLSPTAEELEEQARLEKVSEAKAYLASTDWIVIKISELQLEGVDVEPLKTKYTDELAERKLMREVV